MNRAAFRIPAGAWLGAAAVGVLLPRPEIALLAVAVLWILWRPVPGLAWIPAVPLALTSQWAQSTTAYLYASLSGRPLPDFQGDDAVDMVVLALPFLAVLAVSVRAGMRLAGGRGPRPDGEEAARWRIDRLLVLYAASVAGSVLVGRFAWRVAGLTQPLLALGALRYVLLFLLVARLLRAPAGLRWVLALLAFEVVLGFGALYAEWRMPLLVGIMASFAGAGPGGRRRALVISGSLLAAGLALGVLWMGVRGEYRTGSFQGESQGERYGRLAGLLGEWWGDLGTRARENVEFTCSRITGGPYPARAYQRVPSVLPHEDGALLMEAVVHITRPRFLFPEKPAIEVDSAKVRRYSGMWVAGEESGTSVGLSYIAEAWIDFGFPGMFLTALGYGLLFGALLGILRARMASASVADATTAVLAVLTLGSFEIPWTKILGGGLTVLIVVGAFALLAEGRLLRFLRPRPALPPAPDRRGAP